MEKKLWGEANVPGKVVSAPPGSKCTPGQSKSPTFQEIVDGRGDLEGALGGNG